MKRAAILITAALSLTACPQAVKDTCVAIRAADDACNTIILPLADGGTLAVPVSGADLRETAIRVQARDGGASSHEGGAR